jgi:hypothetical protein
MQNCEEWFVIFVKLGFMLIASTKKLKSLKHMALDFWACFTQYSYEYCLHVRVRSKPLKIWDKEGTLFLPFNWPYWQIYTCKQNYAYINFVQK